MIVWQKMYAAGKLFGKVCLKTIRDTFFPNMWSVNREGKRDPIFWWCDIWQKGKAQTFTLARRPPLPQFPPLVRYSNLPIRKTDFEKSERVFSFKATNLQHIRLNMKKRWQILWWHSIYWRLSTHFKMRSI